VRFRTGLEPVPVCLSVCQARIAELEARHRKDCQRLAASSRVALQDDRTAEEAGDGQVCLSGGRGTRLLAKGARLSVQPVVGLTTRRCSCAGSGFVTSMGHWCCTCGLRRACSLAKNR
jgi:hypothetical protein